MNVTLEQGIPRRSFLKAAAAAGVTLLAAEPTSALAAPHGGISDGDAAILRFLAAAELLETDFWQQYTELANGNPACMEALENIDDDRPSYVTQNTNDEFSHGSF